jgi:hypothetical protein
MLSRKNLQRVLPNIVAFIDHLVLRNLLSSIFRGWQPSMRLVEALLFLILPLIAGLNVIVYLWGVGSALTVLSNVGSDLTWVRICCRTRSWVLHAIRVDILGLIQNLLILPFLNWHIVVRIVQRIRFRIINLRHFARGSLLWVQIILVIVINWNILKLGCFLFVPFSTKPLDILWVELRQFVRVELNLRDLRASSDGCPSRVLSYVLNITN